MFDALADAPDRAQRSRSAPETARPLRILFTGYRSHPHVGGQGVYTREVTRALADLGHAVTVVSGPPYPELDPRVDLVELPSLDLFAVDNALAAFRPSFLACWPDLAEWWLHNTGAFGEPYAFGARYAAWMKSNAANFDIVHDNQSLTAGHLAAAKRGTPTVATLHHPISVDLDIALKQKDTVVERVLLRRWHAFLKTQIRVARALPAILTVSQAAKAAAVADFGLDPARVHVAANGVDHDAFRPRPEIAREDGLVVAAASADVPLKGLVDLIHAFNRVSQARPDARLIVIGRLRDGLAKAAIAAYDLDDRITFREALTRDEVADLYARACVFAAPSRFEGFGFPAAEAMATGAAVVAAAGGALPEVVGDAGIVTPVADPPALAAGILELLGDEARRHALGARAAARAKTAFSWRAHAQAALDVYARAGVDVHSDAHRRA